MTILHTWAVNSMTAYPQAEGETDVVFQIAWVVSATDGTYNSAAYGSVNTTYVAGTPVHSVQRTYVANREWLGCGRSWPGWYR